jgi:cell division septum initiation protein DivIVA
MSAAPESQPELPVGFRGYERAATDAFLATLEGRFAALAHERDELRRQVSELKGEVEQHRSRLQAVGDALVTAELVAGDLRERAEAEIGEQRRQAAEERLQMAEEGNALRNRARQEAAEIVREARLRADRLIEEVVAALEGYRVDTDQFLAGTRERLDALVRELLARIPGSAPAETPEPAIPAGAEPDAPAAGIAAA